MSPACRVPLHLDVTHLAIFAGALDIVANAGLRDIDRLSAVFPLIVHNDAHGRELNLGLVATFAGLDGMRYRLRNRRNDRRHTHHARCLD